MMTKLIPIGFLLFCAGCGPSQLTKNIHKKCQDKDECIVSANEVFTGDWEEVYLTYGPSLSEAIVELSGGVVQNKGVQDGEHRIVKIKHGIVIKDHTEANSPRVYFKYQGAGWPEYSVKFDDPEELFKAEIDEINGSIDLTFRERDRSD